MEEKRDIKITLAQAREWYNNGNSTLRILALNAYTEDELNLNLKHIKSKVCNACFRINVPVNEVEKYNTLTDLAMIAKFFNGSWKKTLDNTGYFISHYNRGNSLIVDTRSGVGVHYHSTVQYAGIIYFKNQEDAIKAIKILMKSARSG